MLKYLILSRLNTETSPPQMRVTRSMICGLFLTFCSCCFFLMRGSKSHPSRFFLFLIFHTQCVQFWKAVWGMLCFSERRFYDCPFKCGKLHLHLSCDSRRTLSRRDFLINLSEKHLQTLKTCSSTAHDFNAILKRFFVWILR